MKPMELELTTLSSKGQLVVPKDIREIMHIKEGSVLAITAYPDKDMIVFKTLKREDMKKELSLVKETEKAWKDIESGRFKKTSKEDFLKEFRKW